MKSARFITICVAIVLVLAQGAWAAETKKAAGEDLPHTAVYEVPELTADLSKQLVNGLSKVEGILSAKPDMKASTFSVTFAPAKTDTEVIKTALDVVAPQVALHKVGPADPKQAHTDCSKCPKKAGCSKKK